MSPELKYRIQVALALAIVIAALRVAYVFYQRHADEPSKPAAQAPPQLPLYGKPIPTNEWIDVLPYTDLDRDRLSDFWELRKDGVGCRGTSGCGIVSW